jgi:methionine biosynthesis protein MetW
MARQRYCMPDPTVGLTDELIREHVEPGSRVIDLGCGDGRLLAMLRDTHGCDVLGVELDRDEVVAAVARGLPVIHADLDQGLSEVPDLAFDFAVLSQTLQQVRHPKTVLEEVCRIARRSLVVVPNFAHWRIRWQALTQGRAPVTSALPYEWYDTPNLHVMSTTDFRDLVGMLRFRIVKELPIIRGRAVQRAWAANLRAESALYVLERADC